jgi:nucleoid DNA-binding protein
MNKEDLIQHLFINQSDKKKISKIKISEIVDKLFDKISDELNNGKEIQISDFGTFSLTTKSLRSIVKYSMKKKR